MRKSLAFEEFLLKVRKHADNSGDEKLMELLETNDI